MNKTEILKEAFDFENREGGEHLAEKFQGTDSVGGAPLDKASWVGMGDMMKGSFPDINYVIEDIREQGDDLIVAGRFSGTFTNDFDASALGLSVIPATGKTVDFATSNQTISFEGDKISKIHNTDTGADAGLGGFLKALGAEMG